MARRGGTKHRVIILTASFGGPHRMAADALQRYLKTVHAGTVEAEVVDFLESFLPSANVLARLAYQRSEPFFPVGLGTLADVSGRWGELPVLQELSISGRDRFEEFLRARNPDAVVSTLSFAAGVAAESCARTQTTTALVLTDNGLQSTWIHPSTELFFVPHREVLEDLVVAKVPYDRVVLTGVPLHERFAEPLTRMACRKELGIPDRFTALVVGGGAQPCDLKAVATGLVRSGVRVLFLLEREDRMRHQLEATAHLGEGLRVVDASAGLNKLLGAADVVVTAGGGPMVLNAIASTVPAIIYTPVPGQELHNIDFLINAGAALLARDENDVVEKVRYLSTHSGRLSQMAGTADALRRPGAAKAICERVLAAF